MRTETRNNLREEEFSSKSNGYETEHNLDDEGIFEDSGEGLGEVVEFPSTSKRVEATVQPKKKLLCISDSEGNPLVAKATKESGKDYVLTERYRRPTQAEWEKIQKNGRIIQRPQEPEVVNQVVNETQDRSQSEMIVHGDNSPLDVTQENSPLEAISGMSTFNRTTGEIQQKSKTSKYIKIGGAVLAVAGVVGAGVFFYKKRASKNIDEDFDNDFDEDDYDDDYDD